MVLDHVPRGADAVVVSGATTQADVLGHGDLDVIDVMRNSRRVEQLVREAQREDVLDGFLAEVVIDPEDRMLREHLVDNGVELFRALQIVAERLLDDHSPPLVLGLVRETRARQLLAHHRERRRRNGQVERVVAVCTALLVQLTERVTKFVEGLGVVERALYEPESFAQPLPDIFAERRPGVRPDRVVHDLAEVLVIPVAARETDEGEPGWQQPTVGEVVDRRHQLPASQIPGDAEDDQTAWSGDPG